MSEAQLIQLIQQATGATAVQRQTRIQSLWSGYGEVVRFALQGCDIPSLIVKHIQFPTEQHHPRGWNTGRSHSRKVKSYAVEMAWYQHWSESCLSTSRIPHCYATHSLNDEHILLLEDLDAAGFSLRKTALNKHECKLGLAWLAQFHAQFISKGAEHLWQEGTYWHLNTRPDEWQAMSAGELKSAAQPIAFALQQAKFQTLVHGDAKVANFCFSADGTSIAAVDFQYIGGGCGIKDVAYFLGSCLHDQQLTDWQDELLDAYFKHLTAAASPNIDVQALEHEWRSLYPMAWADFYRFLAGWMPTHAKINDYGQQLTQKALLML